MTIGRTRSALRIERAPNDIIEIAGGTRCGDADHDMTTPPVAPEWVVQEQGISTVTSKNIDFQNGSLELLNTSTKLSNIL
jgi:hypothetical protein